jgi:hypothetical protein
MLISSVSLYLFPSAQAALENPQLITPLGILLGQGRKNQRKTLEPSVRRACAVYQAWLGEKEA